MLLEFRGEILTGVLAAILPNQKNWPLARSITATIGLGTLGRSFGRL